ncbi:MAG: PQQ-binding-like beta-propeller repeat protein [Pirellulales bacterium]
MMRASRVMGWVVGCAVLAGAFAEAQDWPQWRGPNRDGKAAGFTAPQAWPKALVQKWQITVGSGDATPALVGDKLYVFARQGEDEVTLCLNVADGKEVWKDKYTAQAVTGAASRHPGPRSSPAVAEGKVVTLGVGGVLSCLDAASGKLLWRKDLFPKVVPQFFTAMSPLITDGMCVAHLGGKGKAAIVAVDLASGDTKWKLDGDSPAYGSPVLMTAGGTKQIVTQTEKNVVGVSLADGTLLWQIAAPTQSRFFNSATPIVDGTTVIYTGQGKGTKAISIGDAFAVKELWSNDKVGTGYNTPVLKDGFLYGLSDRGNLFCLDAKTGEATWTDSTRRANFGSVVDAGSVMLVLPESAEFAAFKPDGKAFQELAKYKLSEGKTYAHPVVSGNRIFVKDDEKVTLWTTK